MEARKRAQALAMTGVCVLLCLFAATTNGEDAPEKPKLYKWIKKLETIRKQSLPFTAIQSVSFAYDVPYLMSDRRIAIGRDHMYLNEAVLEYPGGGYLGNLNVPGGRYEQFVAANAADGVAAIAKAGGIYFVREKNGSIVRLCDQPTETEIEIDGAMVKVPYVNGGVIAVSQSKVIYECYTGGYIPEVGSVPQVISLFSISTRREPGTKPELLMSGSTWFYPMNPNSLFVGEYIVPKDRDKNEKRDPRYTIGYDLSGDRPKKIAVPGRGQVWCDPSGSSFLAREEIMDEETYGVLAGLHSYSAYVKGRPEAVVRLLPPEEPVEQHYYQGPDMSLTPSETDDPLFYPPCFCPDADTFIFWTGGWVRGCVIRDGTPEVFSWQAFKQSEPFQWQDDYDWVAARRRISFADSTSRCFVRDEEILRVVAPPERRQPEGEFDDLYGDDPLNWCGPGFGKTMLVVALPHRGCWLMLTDGGVVRQFSYRTHKLLFSEQFRDATGLVYCREKDTVLLKYTRYDENHMEYDVYAELRVFPDIVGVRGPYEVEAGLEPGGCLSGYQYLLPEPTRAWLATRKDLEEVLGHHEATTWYTTKTGEGEETLWNLYRFTEAGDEEHLVSMKEPILGVLGKDGHGLLYEGDEGTLLQLGYAKGSERIVIPHPKWWFIDGFHDRLILRHAGRNLVLNLSDGTMTAEVKNDYDTCLFPDGNPTPPFLLRNGVGVWYERYQSATFYETYKLQQVDIPEYREAMDTLRKAPIW